MKFQGNSDATRVPLRLIYFAGLHPDNTSKLADAYFVINNFVWLFISYLAAVEMTRSDTIEIALEPCQSLLTIIQGVLESLPARYHKDTLKTIIDETSKFWPVENASEQVEKGCLDFLQLVGSFCKNWVYYVGILTFSFNLAPAFLGGLPYPCYVPGDHRLLIYAIQLYATATLVMTLIGNGVMFASICAETVVQFRLLEHEFEQFGQFEQKCGDVRDVRIPDQDRKVHVMMYSTRSGRNYRELVDHHNFLLEYCEQLRKYGNEIFVLKVVMATVTMCAHLFITLQGNFSLINKIKCGMFFGSQLVDFAWYCVAAELVSSASVSAGNAIYSSDWLGSSSPAVRRTVVMVLARAQKQFNFVGQGLVIINLSTMTSVFRAALSFQAYLRTMSAKGNN